MSELFDSAEYAKWLGAIKVAIRDARRHASVTVNLALVSLYWRIGREILERQNRSGWGAKVVEQLARDLRAEFPDMKGLSRSNLLYMRSFAETWSDEAIVPQLVGQLPWGQNRTLLAVRDEDARVWYARQAISNAWSRNILVHHIETDLYGRTGKAATNFMATMDPDRAAQALDSFKDPYVLDFIALSDDAKERDLEKALVERVSNLLRELGKGFAFIGSQHHIEAAGKDYYLDLLFYHTRLHSYVVVDLKIGDFQPEYAGKMNFYLSAVDDLLRVDGDNSSIGLILCKGKNGLEVEYALRDINKPMAVSEYRFLPANIATELPSPGDLRRVADLLDDATPSDDETMSGPSASKP